MAIAVIKEIKEVALQLTMEESDYLRGSLQNGPSDELPDHQRLRETIFTALHKVTIG